jgi:hypothetical protein
MTDKDLIKKIQLLKQVRPRKDWVVLTKNQILGEQPGLIEEISLSLRWALQYKTAFATLVVFAVLAGTIGFAQDSLPGEVLYSVKKITERGQAVFVSEEELPKYNLEIANKRLEELSKIAQTNQVKKLAPALNEFKYSVSEAAESLTRIKEPEKVHKAGREIVKEMRKLEENKEKIETYGVVIGDAKEIENAMCQLVKREIEGLGTLTEEQEELLSEAEQYLEKGKCGLAFEKILLLSYPQE